MEATSRDLETQLSESRVELAIAKKIHAKVDKALVLANEEVICLNALLIKE